MKADKNSKRHIEKRQKAMLRRGGSRSCFVYGLSLNGTVHYVGQTRCPLPKRLAFHLKSADPAGSPVQRWLVGVKPDIVMLVKNAVWNVDEIIMIERLRAAGFRLLNVKRGGPD